MVKLFKKADQTFTPNNGGAVLGLVNTAFSDRHETPISSDRHTPTGYRAHPR